jgi:hypothetical protein
LQEAVGRAFAGHGIALGSAAMVRPRSTLSGSATVRRGSVALSAGARKDLRGRLGVAPHTSLEHRVLQLGPHELAEISHWRPIKLGALSPTLQDVQGLGRESLLVSSNDGSAALMSPVPDAVETEQEVRTYIEGLSTRGQIETAGSRAHLVSAVAAVKGAVASVVSPSKGSKAETAQAALLYPKTHRIKMNHGIRIVERIQFACRCGSH